MIEIEYMRTINLFIKNFYGVKLISNILMLFINRKSKTQHVQQKYLREHFILIINILKMNLIMNLKFLFLPKIKR